MRLQRRKTMRGEPPTEAQRLENVFRKKFPPCCRAGDAVDACLCVAGDGAGFVVYGLPGGKTECAVVIMRLWRSLSVTGSCSLCFRECRCREVVGCCRHLPSNYSACYHRHYYPPRCSAIMSIVGRDREARTVDAAPMRC